MGRLIGTGTRFLICYKKPVNGETCKGKETLANGQTEMIKTGIVREVKELLSGKYQMKTDDGIYLVDVIYPF